jgi:hypothetical protein
MSISDVMSSVTAIQQLLGQLDTPPGQVATTTTPAPASQGSFADALTAASTPAASSTSAASSAQTESTMLASMLEQSQAQSLVGTLGSDDSDDSSSMDALSGLESLTALMPQTAAAAPASPTAVTSTGVQLLGAAESQVGVTEVPMGSNDGPQISMYRDAVAGAAPSEPWCASFVSWAAAQAGEPVGANGQGTDSVAQLTDWAASNGRLLPASATPAPGDLILFGTHHVGVVESVNPDGSLTTIEGNYNNAVSRVHRLPSEATGYVQM